MLGTAVKSTSTLTIITVRKGQEVDKEVIKDGEQRNSSESQG